MIDSIHGGHNNPFLQLHAQGQQRNGVEAIDGDQTSPGNNGRGHASDAASTRPFNPANKAVEPTDKNSFARSNKTDTDPKEPKGNDSVDGNGQLQETEADKEKAKESADGLTEEEREQVRKLAARDSEVRAHESAHLAAAGGLASGGASFTQQRGPDGRMYAVGGEVSIDTSSGNTPQETLQKARQIRAAALAPASPSGQDMSVAASAGRMETNALKQIQEERTEELREATEEKKEASKSTEGTNTQSDSTTTPQNNIPGATEKSEPRVIERSVDADIIKPPKANPEIASSALKSNHNFQPAHVKVCSNCLGNFFNQKVGYNT